VSPAPASRAKVLAYCAMLVVFAASWIHPLWPLEQGMHASIAIVGMAWLVVHARRWPMTDGAFALACLFLAVHAIAARWLYSNVPYDAWLQSSLGWSPDAAFGWTRNHFDRFVHLLYGLCFAPALVQYARARWGVTGRGAFALAVLAVMASSLVYEWLEWGIALALAPGQAEAYNGQQGDIWDAHMDMLLATIGAIAAAAWSSRRGEAGA
jgi:putative membrane protein